MCSSPTEVYPFVSILASQSISIRQPAPLHNTPHLYTTPYHLLSSTPRGSIPSQCIQHLSYVRLSPAYIMCLSKINLWNLMERWRDRRNYRLPSFVVARPLHDFELTMKIVLCSYGAGSLSHHWSVTISILIGHLEMSFSFSKFYYILDLQKWIQLRVHLNAGWRVPMFSVPREFDRIPLWSPVFDRIHHSRAEHSFSTLRRVCSGQTTYAIRFFVSHLST